VLGVFAGDGIGFESHRGLAVWNRDAVMAAGSFPHTVEGPLELDGAASLQKWQWENESSQLANNGKFSRCVNVSILKSTQHG
jgi:hypothetical protein